MSSGLHSEPAGRGHTGSLEGWRGQSPHQWGPSSSSWCNLDCRAVAIIQLKLISQFDAADQGEIPAPWPNLMFTSLLLFPLTKVTWLLSGRD